MENEELVIKLEEDLVEIAQLIKGYMNQKYLTQLKTKLEGYREISEQNLCKEAQLIKAFIPFMQGESKILQLIVDTMIYNDMIEKSFEEHQELSALYRDENKDRQQIKKLMYKLIFFKLISIIENNE